jgi:hypothetical protein
MDEPEHLVPTLRSIVPASDDAIGSLLRGLRVRDQGAYALVVELVHALEHERQRDAARNELLDNYRKSHRTMTGATLRDLAVERANRALADARATTDSVEQYAQTRVADALIKLLEETPV